MPPNAHHANHNTYDPNGSMEFQLGALSLYAADTQKKKEDSFGSSQESLFSQASTESKRKKKKSKRRSSSRRSSIDHSIHQDDILIDNNLEENLVKQMDHVEQLQASLLMGEVSERSSISALHDSCIGADGDLLELDDIVGGGMTIQEIKALKKLKQDCRKIKKDKKKKKKKEKIKRSSSLLDDNSHQHEDDDEQEEDLFAL